MSGEHVEPSGIERLQREAIGKLWERVARALRLGAGPAVAALYGAVLLVRPGWQSATMFAGSLALAAAFWAGARAAGREEFERSVAMVTAAVYVFCALPAALLESSATALAVTGVGTAVMASVFRRPLLSRGLLATAGIVATSLLTRFSQAVPQTRLPPLLESGYQNGHAVLMCLLIVFLVLEYEKLSAIPFQRLERQANLQQHAIEEVNGLQRAVEPLIDRVGALAASLEGQAREQLQVVRGGEAAIAGLSAAIRCVVERATGTFESFTAAAADEGSSASERISTLLAGYDRLLETLQEVGEGGTALAGRAHEADRLIGSLAETTEVGRALSISARVEAARAGGDSGGFSVVAGELSSMIAGTSASLGQGHSLLRAVFEQASKVAASTREGADRLRADLEALRGAAEFSEAIEADVASVQVRVGLSASALGEKCEQLEQLGGSMRELVGVAERMMASSQKLAAATRRLASSREEIERLLRVAQQSPDAQ